MRLYIRIFFYDDKRTLSPSFGVPMKSKFVYNDNILRCSIAYEHAANKYFFAITTVII